MNNFINKAVKKAHTMNEPALRSLVQNIFNEYSFLDAMVDSISDGIIILDAKNEVVKVNKSLSLILNISLNKTNSIEEIFEDAIIRGFVISTIKSEEKCNSKEFFIQGVDKNQYIEISILPLVKHKKINGNIIIVSNITEKKMSQLREERLEGLARLATAAASISHEIKNPLAAISIHVQLLEKMLTSSYEMNEKMKRHFSVIEEEIERLNKIVVDFLFAVRPIKFEFTDVNINDLLSSLIETFKDEALSNNIKINFDSSFNLSSLQGDERFLRQAFMNVILNAEHAMKEKGGVLTIKTKEDESFIVIEISDCGEGIPKNLLDKIFEPYFTTKNDGTGLGLTLTYKVIKEHGGDIHVYSALGKGTTFRITLPVCKCGNCLLISYDNSL